MQSEESCHNIQQTWRMQLEMIILSEVSQGRESLIPSDITHTRNLKYGTPEPAYEQGQTHRHGGQTCRLPREDVRGLEGEFGTSSCQLLHTEWTNSKSYCIAQPYSIF